MHRTFADASKKESINFFKKMVFKVHENDAKIFCQLTHAGPNKMDSTQSDMWSPSQVIEGSRVISYTLEMDKHNINDLINSFKKSSSNVIESDFDGIELKVAHDGVLRAFISPYYNKRNDKYGGSFENRARILVEILSSIKEINKNDIPVGIRLCMDEFEDEGYKLEFAVEVAKYLESKNLIDYVSTDAGNAGNSLIMQVPPMSIVLGYAEYMAAALKKEIKIPVIAFGRINDPVQAEQILQNESADLIGMARQLICDPETPNKSKRGKIDDIRKCIGCVDGCISEVLKGQPLNCIQNLAVGIEKEYGIGTLKKAKILKRVIIAGGGVSGMKTAEICAKRGHKVILFEKSEILGGQLNLLKKIPFRNEFSEVIRYLEYQIKNNKNIDIRTEIEANKKILLDEKPDVAIIATGAYPYIPEEFKDKKTVTSWDILNGMIKPEGKIIIYDKFGKSEGIGVAEYILDNYNSEIIFYTPLHYAGQDVSPLNLDILYRKMFTKKFKVYPNYIITNLSKGKATFEHNFSHKNTIESDYSFIILTGNMRSNDNLYKELEERVAELYRVGDAKAPRIVQLSIHGAEELARNI